MLIPVRQKFVRRGLSDVAGEAGRVLAESGLARRLKPGSSVAIGAGSRGISNIAAIVRAVAGYFTSEGHRPFIFPAMGSHGAATAEGQASVLAHYGIDEARMGCPIRSAFDVVSLGRTEDGIEAFAGRDAWESDAIFAVNRIKWHTSFAGGIESGVAKMIAIGLGKQEGAKSVHGHARRMGMDPAIRSVARRILASGKVLGGLGVLEDAFHQTAKIAALPAESLIPDEEELLKTVKSWMGRIPVEAVDVLIVDEIGKNISGTGMDLKIVNRGVAGQVNLWPDAPRIERIFVRDLSALSYGNANGIGAADVLHDRVVQKIDVKAGRINALTSGSLGLVKVPLHFASDRECFELAAATVGRFHPEELTVAWIRNTLELDKIALTENLLPEIRKNADLEIAGDPFELKYDSTGNLAPYE
ncbi:MAG TPA: hypothetical protein VKB79_24515 [Bryobacteraceae bacterium]|nr:hypothetical protein [Bryobacteraceae bacterium]